LRGAGVERRDELAGVRKVKIRGGLHRELQAAISPSAIDLDAYVFPTRTGARMGADNFRNRVLAAAVKRANESLAARSRPPLPTITPHLLRRTFTWVRAVLGDDPGTMADELGHTDPTFSYRVYRQARRQRLSDEEIAELRAMVDGTDWASRSPDPAEAHAPSEA
jgi:integrase